MMCWVTNLRCVVAVPVPVVGDLSLPSFSGAPCLRNKGTYGWYVVCRRCGGGSGTSCGCGGRGSRCLGAGRHGRARRAVVVAIGVEEGSVSSVEVIKPRVRHRARSQGARGAQTKIKQNGACISTLVVIN